MPAPMLGGWSEARGSGTLPSVARTVPAHASGGIDAVWSRDINALQPSVSLSRNSGLWSVGNIMERRGVINSSVFVHNVSLYGEAWGWYWPDFAVPGGSHILDALGHSHMAVNPLLRNQSGCMGLGAPVLGLELVVRTHIRPVSFHSDKALGIFSTLFSPSHMIIGWRLFVAKSSAGVAPRLVSCGRLWSTISCEKVGSASRGEKPNATAGRASGCLPRVVAMAEVIDQCGHPSVGNASSSVVLILRGVVFRWVM